MGKISCTGGTFKYLMTAGEQLHELTSNSHGLHMTPFTACLFAWLADSSQSSSRSCRNMCHSPRDYKTQSHTSGMQVKPNPIATAVDTAQHPNPAKQASAMCGTKLSYSKSANLVYPSPNLHIFLLLLLRCIFTVPGNGTNSCSWRLRTDFVPKIFLSRLPTVSHQGGKILRRKQRERERKEAFNSHS